MTEYTSDSPFPGDYQPGRVDASPGFLHAFEAPGGGLPHFSPASSDQSLTNPGAAVNVDHRPTSSSSGPGGDVHMSGPPGSAHGRFPGHQHTPSGQSGHSHSFSTASLPSLSSSTGFSIASHPEPPPPGMYVAPGLTPNPDYGPPPTHMFPPDTKPMLSSPGMPPPHPGMALAPSIGLGVGIGMPPTPMSATLQPALIGRSPIGPPAMVIPNQGFHPTMGKTPHDRRSVTRPSPYQVQSSRSGSLSLKSEDEELMSIYNAPGQPGYPGPWSGGMIGDMNQMTLEHRRSSSTPFDLPQMGQPIPRSRARSFSLGKSSNSLDFLEQDLDIGGPAAEREAAIRADLSNKAEQVRALSPCQHGKARAVWAKRWLKLSYTPVNGFTVPRQGLYHSYTMSCNDFGLRPINSASFGKVVRSTFLGIRTRRLGVRGNSKYHYVSLRPAISTEAHRLNAYGDSSGQLHIAPQDGDFSMDDHGGDVLTEDETEEEEDDELAELSEGMTYSAHPFPRSQPSGPAGRSRSGSQDEHLVIRSGRPAHMPQNFTPTASGVSSDASAAIPFSLPGAPRPTPPFPGLSAGVDPITVTFWQSFCVAQEQLGRCVAELDLDSFQQNYRSFWEAQAPETLQLCAQPPLASMIVDGMAMSYDHIILSLVDKILGPIPPNAHAALGIMAANFDKMTADSLGGLATEVSRPIIELSGQVGQLLARFLDLHQITTAIGPILAEPEHLAAMRNSWRMLDANFVIRQSTMASGCSEQLLEPAIRSFGNWLNEVGADLAAHPVELLAMCVDGAVGQAEATVNGSDIRAIIPKASYLTSQVMRLLTLRSDMSFGWFQLIKTWVDDYVTLTCVRRAAFARPSPNLLGSGTLQPKDLQSHHNPRLAIDTASATYSTVAPLDQNAITPRPAFTASGAATQATGPGVGGIAGLTGPAGGPPSFFCEQYTD